MTQPTPDVGEQDARRVLERDYAHTDVEAIWSIILQLDVREKWRVALGCLKNGAGDEAALRKDLAEASGYYREILGEAEYPEATRKWTRIEKFSDAEREAIYERDWRQYQEWLNRVGAQ